ncbi:MAG: hypothetical protein GY861_28950 [bacterium]|nr:hypothetical protein [bacterium]
MVKKKKRLSQQQEFEILKIVLDKFLWIGFGIMVLGLYEMYNRALQNGLYLMLAGAIVLVIFIMILVREYEITH